MCIEEGQVNRGYMHKSNLLAGAFAGTLALSGMTAQAIAQERYFHKLTDLSFAEGRPTEETAQTLRDEPLFQRATQT
jgi:hypothetical protein